MVSAFFCKPIKYIVYREKKQSIICKVQDSTKQKILSLIGLLCKTIMLRETTKTLNFLIDYKRLHRLKLVLLKINCYINIIKTFYVKIFYLFCAQKLIRNKNNVYVLLCLQYKRVSGFTRKF